MKKKIYLLLVIVILLTNCKENTTEIDLNSEISQKSVKQKITGDGKFDLLGFGYDLSTGYLDIGSHEQLQIIDVEKLQKERPELFQSNFPDKDTSYSVYGSDFAKWSNGIKSKIDYSGENPIPLYYTGTTQMNIDINEYRNVPSKYSYATFFMIKTLKEHQIRHSIEDLRQYLNPHFLSSLNNLSAEKIVEMYGTHVLTKIKMGGKLEVNYKSTIQENNKEAIVNQGISYEVNRIFDLPTTTTTEFNLKNLNQSVFCYYRTFGGEISKSLFGGITERTQSQKIKLNDWISTINLNNAQMIDIGESGLIPIYKFVTDPVKRNDIKAAVEKYLNTKQPNVVNASIKCSFQLNKNSDKILALHLNNDKYTDLICYSPGFGNVSMNIGIKDGSFIKKTDFRNGIGGYDLKNISDQIIAFDYNGDGLDDLFCYRPSKKIVFILKSTGNGSFQKIILPGNKQGILGFDFADINDKAISLDYNGDGFDDILCYRPGKKISFLIKSNGNDSFTMINNSKSGIGNYDLSSVKDKIVGFDYNNDKYTDLICYRPGNKIVQILKSNGDGTFSTTLSSTNGIGGYDLSNQNDQIISADYNGDNYDDLICYRPSKGILHILKSNGNASFANILQRSNGICNFDLKNTADKLITMDYNNDGKADIIGYRPVQGFTMSARSDGAGNFSLDFTN